jgi:ferredoxin
MLGLTTPDYLERDVYCCGPESFMQSVRESLQSLGYDMARYHQESYGVTPVDGAETELPLDIVPSDLAAAEVRFATSGKTVVGTQADTVLKMAKGAGLNIPSGCNFGLCGTCKIRKLSGEVHMLHNGGISEDDIAGGYILACCSHPLGPVEVAV